MFGPGGPSFVELTVQALSSTKRGYDRLAPKFDRTPFRTPDPVLAQVAERLGPPGSIGRALDLCCGTGAGVAMLRPLCRDEVVGLDFSPGMLAEARRRTAAAPGTAPITLVEGDALALTFDAAFDVVTCFGALGHILEDDQARFLAGIHRALVPGGRFAFVTTRKLRKREPLFWVYHGFNAVMRVRNRVLRPPFHMYYQTFTVPEIVPLLEAVGFDVALHPAAWERRPYVIAVATRR